MRDWKQIIIGHAVRLPSKHPRFYVDVALVIPIIMAIMALSKPIWSRTHSTIEGGEAVIPAAVLLGAFLLTKEKGITFGAALGYMFFVGLVFLPLAPSSEFWPILLMILAAGAACLLIIMLNAHRTEFYKSTTRSDWVVGGIALVCGALFLIKVLS